MWRLVSPGWVQSDGVSPVASIVSILFARRGRPIALQIAESRVLAVLDPHLVAIQLAIWLATFSPITNSSVFDVRQRSMRNSSIFFLVDRNTLSGAISHLTRLSSSSFLLLSASSRVGSNLSIFGTHPGIRNTPFKCNYTIYQK